MTTVQSAQFEAFNKTRSIQPATHLCYAPLLSLNFDQSGNITACCFNRTHVLGTYPQHSVADAWTGLPMKELRAAMEAFDDSLGCRQCTKMIEESNYDSVLIKHFDEYVGISGISKKHTSWWPFHKEGVRIDIDETKLSPTVFEFEISNHCNLECIMCGGKWSSAIRKNREGLPPLKSPYDAAFVEQIRAFLPQLRRANFLGGEPFLISLYYDIWEAIVAINPAIDVAITSNGTMLNKRAKHIIDHLPNCRITLSIDSLKKETWESIRLNGKFEVLSENIEWLLKSKKLKSFSVCPIIQNWQEIPDIIDFCETNHLDVYFNIVYEPLGGRKKGIHEDGEGPAAEGLLPEMSLSRMTADELSEVIAFYKQQRYHPQLQTPLDNLVQQLEHWYQQKLQA